MKLEVSGETGAIHYIVLSSSKNLLRYSAEKILLLNTTNFRGDYPIIIAQYDFNIMFIIGHKR